MYLSLTSLCNVQKYIFLHRFTTFYVEQVLSETSLPSQNDGVSSATTFSFNFATLIISVCMTSVKKIENKKNV